MEVRIATTIKTRTPFFVSFQVSVRAAVGELISSVDLFLVKMVSSPSKKAAAAKKATSKASKTSQHPSYNDMIQQAIAALKERNGASRQKIASYICSNYKGLGENSSITSHLRRALVKALAAGTIINTKGTGASGRFKLVAAAKSVASKTAAAAAAKKKKPAATTAKPKAKSVSAKKSTTIKSVTKKSPAKRKAKSPKKSSTAKSPRKVKPVGKGTTAGKAKKTTKSPAKKPAKKSSK